MWKYLTCIPNVPNNFKTFLYQYRSCQLIFIVAPSSKLLWIMFWNTSHKFCIEDKKFSASKLIPVNSCERNFIIQLKIIFCFNIHSSSSLSSLCRHSHINNDNWIFRLIYLSFSFVIFCQWSVCTSYLFYQKILFCVKTKFEYRVNCVFCENINWFISVFFVLNCISYCCVVAPFIVPSSSISNFWN